MFSLREPPAGVWKCSCLVLPCTHKLENKLIR